MTFLSSLFVGSVVHRRFRPRPHRLRYRLFWMLVDLDEIDQLAGCLRIFSRNRFNLVSFFDRDFGDGGDSPLRAQVTARLAEAGIAFDDGAIRLFCMPRVLGYAFNPLSVYFCYRRDGSLAAILHEVHNTFGERHTYVLAAGPEPGKLALHTADKAFHVSPFLHLDMRYTFRVMPPGERIAIAIRGEDADGLLIGAALAAKRQHELSQRALIRLLVAHPLVTRKVTAGIHWHALRMLLKGFRVYRHPSRGGRPAAVAPAE